MEQQAELQEALISRYEDIYQKTFSNRCGKESARLGNKSEVAQGAFTDELAGIKKNNSKGAGGTMI